MFKSSVQEKNPWIALMFIIVSIAVVLLVVQILEMVIIMIFFADSFQSLSNKIANPFAYPELKWPIIFMQFLVSLCTFIIVPLFFIWKFENKQFDKYFSFKNIRFISVITTIFLVLSFMVVNSFFIEWNINLQFPDYMSGFGDWAREKEDILKQLTLYIIEFDGFGYFVVVFLVVAILPAIGEELLFRGLIQKQINRISGNVHIAIWVSAFLFSAFHIQFFGFVPRLLLGAFFGYLYVFSGNLWYAILAHFVNNGFTLVMIYLYQNKISSFDIQKTESIPLSVVGFAFIIGSTLFYLFYKQVNLEIKLIHE